MQSMLRLPSVIRQNPIVEAEFRYQRFVINRSRAGLIWIILAAAMVVPALLYALYVVMLGLLGIVYPPIVAQQPVGGLLDGGMVALLVMSTSMYIVVTLITLGLAGNSVRREREGHTWDNLRLTDISPAKIVQGKWYASLRALGGDHAMVTVMRLGLVALLVLLAEPITLLLRAAGTQSFVVYLPALIGITIVYSVLDAALTAATGLLASVPGELGGAIIAPLAVGVRLVAMGAAVAWFLLTMHTFFVSNFQAVLLLTLIGFIAYLLTIGLTLYAAQRLVG